MCSEKDLAAVAGFEGGGRGHKPRNESYLLSLEKIRKGILPHSLKKEPVTDCSPLRPMLGFGLHDLGNKFVLLMSVRCNVVKAAIQK
jgi:hypothetical protein